MDSEAEVEILALKEELKKTQLAYQMASEMSQFKAGFLARISHELRSPLNSLIGLHQLILSDLCEDEAEEREFIAQAHSSAMKMVGLLDEILNVAKTEFGSNRLELQRLQLGEILGQVYDLTHLIAANRNIRLNIPLPDPEIYILGDYRWLRQVLLNLVDTPLKLMHEGSITVSTHADPKSGYVHIWVDDQRPEDALREPINLLQLEQKTTDLIEDNFTLSPGLSLLISQTVLDLMKGRLEILAVPSLGSESNLTRIQCSIPLAILQTPSQE